ncbi:hypothetical protein ACTXT7_000652 [Hymenolepis weldensis]
MQEMQKRVGKNRLLELFHDKKREIFQQSKIVRNILDPLLQETHIQQPLLQKRINQSDWLPT